MAALTSLSEEEKRAIEISFPIKTYQKGSYLLKTGQIAHNAYYVIEGCVREYEIVEGEEKTTAFYTENQSVINFHSMTNSSPSKINFVCAETTTVSVLNADKEEQLYRQYPRFEKFCRSGMEQMMGEKQMLLSDYIVLKPEQRYLKLLKDRPKLINRVPQHQIASYLGIKAETLSRIRRRIVKK